jgi:quinol monooxygenase YgiN
VLLVQAQIHALAEGQEAVAAALLRLAGASAAEDGCEEFLVTRLLSDAAEFVALARWRDEAAMRSHYESAAYAAYAAAVTPLLARPTDTAVHAVRATTHPVGDPSSEPIRQD